MKSIHQITQLSDNKLNTVLKELLKTFLISLVSPPA